jgi:hypothetical protein
VLCQAAGINPPKVFDEFAKFDKVVFDVEGIH